MTFLKHHLIFKRPCKCGYLLQWVKKLNIRINATSITNPGMIPTFLNNLRQLNNSLGFSEKYI